MASPVTTTSHLSSMATLNILYWHVKWFNGRVVFQLGAKTHPLVALLQNFASMVEIPIRADVRQQRPRWTDAGYGVELHRYHH